MAGTLRRCLDEEGDLVNQKERMLAGLPYKAWLDGLTEEREACKALVYELNTLRPEERSRIPEIVKRLFGKTGETVYLEPPFHCDYGYNIEVWENFGANYNLTILDVGKVTFGDNVLIAPNVSIYTAGHPVHPQSRNSGYEYGIPIAIGSNVWIGGSVVILPGVTIGDNVVIGAGSVVTQRTSRPTSSRRAIRAGLSVRSPRKTGSTTINTGSSMSQTAEHARPVWICNLKEAYCNEPSKT